MRNGEWGDEWSTLLIDLSICLSSVYLSVLLLTSEFTDVVHELVLRLLVI